jgi:hypothetical protein
VSNAAVPAGFELHEIEDTSSAQQSVPSANTVSKSVPDESHPNVSATPVYSCPSEYSLGGYNLKGNTCSKPTTTQATPNYMCPEGQTVAGNTCTTTSSATVTSYTCQTGFTLNGTTCVGIMTNPASIVGFACPTGYTLTDSICTKPAAQQMIASASLPDGSPVRIGPLVQRVWIKSYNDKNDMLTSDQVVYKEVVATHWAGQAPIQGSQGTITGGMPGAYPHRPAEQPAPLLTTPGLLQTDKKDSNTNFSQPGSQSQNGETAPELSDNNSKSMPN